VKKSKFLKNRKQTALSLVALILILMMTVGITYSWIDDVKQVTISTTKDGDNTPLKSGIDINSDIVISKADTSINLGRILENSDYKYTYTENNETKSHNKYEHNPENPDRDPQWNQINSKKGYFYESGDMHLSGCYSDGETFYFPKTNDSGYREGIKDDENVNYISVTTKVSSPYANVDFWFDDDGLPTIKNHGGSAIGKARIAIDVDGRNNVYSSSGSASTLNNGNVTAVDGVRKFSKYTFNNEDNTTASRGENSNVLFSIKKGDTVNLNIKVWLEPGFDSDITASDIDFTLVSSWGKSRTIKIVDKTTTNTKTSWLNDNRATMFLTCPKILEQYDSEIYASADVGHWRSIRATTTGDNKYNYQRAPFYQLHLKSGTTDTYEVTVPYIYNGEEMILYRCSADGWNTGSHNGKTGDHGVTYWNWWKTTVPNSYTTETYTLYGGSHDNYAGNVVDENADNKWESYLGYGTWGSVFQLLVYQNYNETNWAKKNDDNDNLYIRDYSDEATSGETYVHSMRWDSDNNRWIAYIPDSSTLLQFLYTDNSVIKGCYGYNSYNSTNPQTRPTDAVSYHITFKNDYKPNGESGNVDGIGYWNNAKCVYLIKKGNDFGNLSNLTAYLFYKYNDSNGYNSNFESTFENKTFPGTSMTKISEQFHLGGSTYDVYKSDDLDSSNGNNMFPDRRKSTWGNDARQITVDTTVTFSNSTKSKQTKDKVVYPGCFYDPEEDQWYGSLTGSGRSAASSSVVDDDSGSDSGSTDSISGYTTKSAYYLNDSLNNKFYFYTVGSSGTTYKAVVALNSTAKQFTILNNGTNYGVGESTVYTAPYTNGFNAHTGSIKSFGLNASVAGNYIVTMKVDSSTNLKIESVLKQE
jgi:hypothetical protein